MGPRGRAWIRHNGELFILMINSWKEYLKINGFEKIGRREYLCSSSPVASLIYETPPRVGGRDVRINLAVEIYDPWICKQAYHAMHLRGDLAPEGIFVHYHETPRWLCPDEGDIVYEILKQCLTAWVDYWSNPIHLIKYFECPVDTVLTRQLGVGEACEHLFGLPTKKRASPQTDYLLSLLYYHTGNFKEALAAAKRYFQFIAQMTSYAGEPERTKRQIDKLSAKASTFST